MSVGRRRALSSRISRALDFLTEGTLGVAVPAFAGAGDYVTISLQTGTHWDGLAHSHHGDSIYNGFWIGNTSSWPGITRCTTSRVLVGGRAPGIGLDVVEWLDEAEVAALATDTATVEVVPSETGDLHPLHSRLLRDLGLTLGELWSPEELADACA